MYKKGTKIQIWILAYMPFWASPLKSILTKRCNINKINSIKSKYKSYRFNINSSLLAVSHLTSDIQF